MARRAAKRSTVTVGREIEIEIEIETDRNPFNSCFLWSAWLATWIAGACAQRRSNDDGVSQHGVHTPANTKSASLGLQRYIFDVGPVNKRSNVFKTVFN